MHWEISHPKESQHHPSRRLCFAQTPVVRCDDIIDAPILLYTAAVGLSEKKKHLKVKSLKPCIRIYTSVLLNGSCRSTADTHTHTQQENEGYGMWRGEGLREGEREEKKEKRAPRTELKIYSWIPPTHYSTSFIYTTYHILHAGSQKCNFNREWNGIGSAAVKTHVHLGYMSDGTLAVYISTWIEV